MKRMLLVAGFAVALVGNAFAQGAPAPERPKDGWPTIFSFIGAKSNAPMTVSSSAFKEGSPVAETHTAFGKNVSPPLAWSKGPDGTRSYVFILEDPDGGAGPNPVFHWVVYDIPASVQAFPAELPAEPKLASLKGAMQGLNNRNEVGYRGPRPPAGETHAYMFQVYAMDTTLNLDPAKANRKAIVDAMQGHVLAKGKMVAPTTGK